MDMSSFEQLSLLHVLSSLMFVAPYIYANSVNNNDVHRGLEVVSNGKDIHSLLDVTKEKVGDLPLNMCSILQSNNYDNVLKYIVGYYMLTPTKAPKQMGT
jgi:hypothetical protein